MNGELAYFDWTDACIAHPFIDLHSLQWQKDEATRAALLDGASAHGRSSRTSACAGCCVGQDRDPAAPRGLLPAHRRPPRAGRQAGLDATHQFLREILAAQKPGHSARTCRRRPSFVQY